LGEITIDVRGSFKNKPFKKFTAMHGGHAQAIAEAIEFLSGDFLSDAIKQDHKAQEQGAKPELGFGEKRR